MLPRIYPVFYPAWVHPVRMSISAACLMRRTACARATRCPARETAARPPRRTGSGGPRRAAAGRAECSRPGERNSVTNTDY